MGVETFAQGILGGVAYNPPPEAMMPAVNDAITAALNEIKDGKHIGAVLDIKTTTGINGAVVAKVSDGFKAIAWIGKSWGSGPVYGASIRAAF